MGEVETSGSRAPITVPPLVESIWRQHGVEQSPPRAGLSVAAITAAAMALADAEGIAAVAMARVARELGFTPMALYRHIASKDELLMLMADAGIEPPPRELATDLDWREGLRTWMTALLAVYTRRPWLLAIPIQGAPLLPNTLGWMDWSLALMAETGLAAAEQVATTLLMSGYVRNEASLLNDLRHAERLHGPVPGDLLFDQVLATLVPPERMPALAAAFQAGAFSGPSDDDLSDMEFAFSFGMERILDGLGALIQARAEQQ